MATFSKSSSEKLETCNKDIQTVMNEVIKYFDFTVTCGHRPPAEQFELFKKGRKEVDGIWVIENKKKIVTYKDGYIKLSKHNKEESEAVDITPYPIDWNNKERFILLGGYVMGISKVLKEKGIIDKGLTWGADWDNDNYIKDHNFIDLPHYQTA